MKRIISFMLCLCLACAAPVMTIYAAQETTPSGLRFEEIGSKMEAKAESNKDYYASFATAVFCGDEVLYEKHFGYIDRENRVLADENCVYEWGSVSKLFVWVSVLQLYEQGKIDLNEDIRDYLPEDFFKKLKYDEPITMLHLMNHNAGWEETTLPIETENEEDILSLEEALRKTEPAQTFRPGEITAYSNWGTALAGYIVERISGMEYAEYVRENILLPLEMEETSVRADYRDNEWVRASREKEKSYLMAGNKQEGLITEEDLGTGIRYIQIYPAGAVISTLSDMTRFAQAFVNEDCPLFKSRETLEFMLSASDFYGDSKIPKNCHGLWCAEYAVSAMGHAGNTTGGSANLVFDKESKIGVVVMTNQQAESLFCYGIPEMIFGRIDENPIYENAVITSKKDVSGDYVMSRGYFEGALKIHPGLSYAPIRASEEKGVFTLLDEPAMIQFGDNLYRMTGSNDIVYATTTPEGKNVLECSTMTMLLDEKVAAESSAVTVFAGIVVAGVILLLVMCAGKVLNIGEKMPAAKWILTGVIAVLLIGLPVFAIKIDATMSLVLVQRLRAIFGCSTILCLMVCLLSAGAALKVVVKEKGMKATKRLKYLLYALCHLYVIGFVMYFRLFYFLL